MFAHETRTALTGILALSELLSTADLGDRERQWAMAVKDTAEHLAALTTLIVESGRAKAGRLDLRRDDFSLHLFVEAAGAGLQARAQAKGLHAQVSMGPDPPVRARGDAVRLRAALENLIDNAVKFTEHGSVSLEFSARALPRGKLALSFVVADTGVGLDRPTIKRLFRPYAQASADIIRRYGGTGLGLVAVKRLAKAMGGDLTVVSTPGKGSRFRLDVTLAQASPSASLPQRPSALALPLQRLRILCAEDNPFGRVILDTILTELGHQATFVASGEAAVEAAARGDYDAVLMDISLPAPDGLTATRRIRTLPGRAGLPIIGLSSRADPADEAQARAAGMNLYLRKPIGPRALAIALAQVMADASDHSAS